MIYSQLQLFEIFMSIKYFWSYLQEDHQVPDRVREEEPVGG